MKLNDFTFLADENMSPTIINFLKAEGFDVKGAIETNMVSAKDTDWLALSCKENRVIITQDSDFSQLVFTQPINFVGIIFLRPGSFFPSFHIQTLTTLFEQDLEVEEPFIITAKNNESIIQVKIRYF